MPYFKVKNTQCFDRIFNQWRAWWVDSGGNGWYVCVDTLLCAYMKEYEGFWYISVMQNIWSPACRMRGAVTYCTRWYHARVHKVPLVFLHHFWCILKIKWQHSDSKRNALAVEWSPLAPVVCALQCSNNQAQIIYVIIRNNLSRCINCTSQSHLSENT